MDEEARAEIIQKRVIRCEGDTWGVTLLYSDYTRVAYPVGSREDAERELINPRPDPFADA